MSNQQPESLVKYDIPILVSTSVAGKKTKKKQQQLAPLEKTATTRNEDYLNSILPPREYTENGQLWVRYVSPTPATRVDVINLQDDLLELKRTLSACQTDKVNWQLSSSLYEQDLLLKRYNITIANKMQFVQNEKLALAHRFIDVQTAQISTLSRQLCQLQINYENLRHELRLLQAQYL